MIKNYQTIIDPGKGNCVAACISSMFNLTIDEVPKFGRFQSVCNGE